MRLYRPRSHAGHIGTKTAVQIRSHAQKFFAKAEKEPGVVDFHLPPPRRKRKPGCTSQAMAQQDAEHHSQPLQQQQMQQQQSQHFPPFSMQAAMQPHPLMQAMPHGAIFPNLLAGNTCSAGMQPFMGSAPASFSAQPLPNVAPQALATMPPPSAPASATPPPPAASSTHEPSNNAPYESSFPEDVVSKIAAAAIAAASTTAQAVIAAAGPQYVNMIQELAQHDPRLRFLSCPLGDLMTGTTGPSGGNGLPGSSVRPGLNSGSLPTSLAQRDAGMHGHSALQQGAIGYPGSGPSSAFVPHSFNPHAPAGHQQPRPNSNEGFNGAMHMPMGNQFVPISQAHPSVMSNGYLRSMADNLQRGSESTPSSLGLSGLQHLSPASFFMHPSVPNSHSLPEVAKQQPSMYCGGQEANNGPCQSSRAGQMRNLAQDAAHGGHVAPNAAAHAQLQEAQQRANQLFCSQGNGYGEQGSGGASGGGSGGGGSGRGFDGSGGSGSAQHATGHKAGKNGSGGNGSGGSGSKSAKQSNNAKPQGGEGDKGGPTLWTINVRPESMPACALCLLYPYASQLARSLVLQAAHLAGLTRRKPSPRNPADSRAGPR
jgi:hypothetical protein